jgi:hypothetical protein
METIRCKYMQFAYKISFNFWVELFSSGTY